MFRVHRYILLSIALATSFACAVPDAEHEEGTGDLTFLETDSQGAVLESLAPESQDTRPGSTPRGEGVHALAGSCVNYCGGQSPGGCWCDDSCSRYGDCCTDFQQTCNQLKRIRVSLYTGNDDKREDTSVWLRLKLTGDKHRDFLLSPNGQRLPDRTLRVTEFSLSPSIGRDQVVGCELIVDLGEGDGVFRHRDNWWMNGLVIDGYTSSYRTLRNHAGWSFKFVEDRTLLPLPCP